LLVPRGCRAAKALEGALQEIKQEAFPRCPTRAVCGAYISLQREVIELLKLKRSVQAKQVSDWAWRGGWAAEPEAGQERGGLWGVGSSERAAALLDLCSRRLSRRTPQLLSVYSS
jgi:hypothetical protein